MAVFLSLAQTAHTDTIKSHIVGLPSLGESTAVKQMIDFLFLFFFLPQLDKTFSETLVFTPLFGLALQS